MPAIKSNISLALSGSASQHLTLAVLDSGHVAFEFHPAKETLPLARRKVEKYFYELYKTDPSRALLALGLTNSSFCLSPSVEFWRSISSAFIHAVLTASETESLREKMQVALLPEETTKFLNRIPAMIGAERVTTTFLEKI